jgi:hypothetical protein
VQESGRWREQSNQTQLRFRAGRSEHGVEDRMLLQHPAESPGNESRPSADLPALGTLEEIQLADRRETYLSRRAERERLDRADSRAAKREAFELFREELILGFWAVFTVLSLIGLLAGIFLDASVLPGAASGSGALGGAIALGLRFGVGDARR